jgi:predicted nucleic acid-binding protein
MANEEEPWATEIYDEILDGERIVYIPRYVLTEFHQVMLRNRGRKGEQLAWEHITSLYDTPAAVTPHPNRFRVDVDAVRHHASTRTLAAICDMEPKDAPILATAYRLVEFIENYDPPTHSSSAIPKEPEEFRLKRLLNEVGVDSITAQILTNEQRLVNADLNQIGLGEVEVTQLP